MKNHLLFAISIMILLSIPSSLLASDGDNVKTAREVVTMLNAGQFKEVISKFDSTMKKAAPEARLEAIWKSLTAETGSLQEELSDSSFVYGGYDIVIVTCEFQKATLGVKLVFDKDGKIAGLFFTNLRPHTNEEKSGSESGTKGDSTGTGESEAKGATYVSRDVTFENRKAGITLAGTLTLPDSTGKFPAVLLISGSGPNGRNETVAGHKLFLVLADYLASHGIAVLRYDKRGIGKSTGNYSEAMTMDFASDALAGVNYLMTLKQINHKEIGLIGHSEGGEIAPIVADESPNVAFIVLMAGPGVPGEDILLSQSGLIMKANGAPDSTIRMEHELQRKLFEVVMTEKDSAKAEVKLRKILEEGAARLGVSNAGEQSKEAFVNTQLRALRSPWLKFFLSYDPRPALEKLKCPVLALWGSKDLQVPPAENMPTVEKALKSGGNTDFKIVELPGLNHLFQDAKTGSSSEYAVIKETISPKVLDVITKWILKEIGKRRG